MSRRTLLLGLVAVVALLAVAVLTLVARAQPTVATVTVESSPFRVRVIAEGNLAAVKSTPLTAPMKPSIPFTLAWLLEDGTLVEKDELIARFDATQLEKDLEDGLSDQRISDHKIASARTRREVSVDKLEQDVAIAEQELEVATEFQSLNEQVYSAMEIIRSQIDTELAGNRADHARDSQEIQGDLSEAEIELLTIDRRKAEIKVQQADEGLAALEVRAPHNGIVLLERDWRGNPTRVGDTVWPGRPIARIPNLAEMQAEVYVLEADAGDLEAGQGATVWLEASPEIGHGAAVKSVDPMAGRRYRNVPVQYFRTILALESTDPETMKPGSRVRAEIVIADLDKAITVPRQAVCERDGQMVVHRWTRRAFEAVPVELGPAALGRVVIADGISDGDVVALRDPDARTTEQGSAAGGTGPSLPGGAS
jgi:multidrug efflux pump subunit AcrA (membrane-fusion protein)